MADSRSSSKAGSSTRKRSSRTTSRSKRPKSKSNSQAKSNSPAKSKSPARPNSGSKLAGKAKVPLVAGGAALVGAAGGLAVGSRMRRHDRGVAGLLPRPQIKVDSGDVRSLVKEVGSFGAQMGRLASELQNAREATNGGRHRSPIEVVLDGLTGRRPAN